MSEKGERLTEHKNLQKGDLVRIKGEPGATYKVVWVEVYEGTERPEEVTVIGGKYGKSSWRTFLLSRVIKKPKRQQIQKEQK